MTTNGDRHRRTVLAPPDAPRTPDGYRQYRQRTMMQSDDIGDSERRTSTDGENRASPDPENQESTDDDPANGFEPAVPVDAEEPSPSTAASSESATPVDAAAATDDPKPAPTDGEAAGGRTDDGGRLVMPVETLSVLNWLGNIGVEGVESRLDRIAADDVTVETEKVKVDYSGPETVLSQFSVEDRAGARVRLEKPFAGDVLVLFPIKSANRAASLMLQRAVEDVESVVSTPMGRDALTELCNVMANGFVDEWATVFDAPFDTGAPVAVQNPELTLLHRIFSDTDVGLYLTASFRLVEHDVDATIFVFPGEERFVNRISQVDPATIDR